MNGTSVDNAIVPTDAKSPCIVWARLISWVPALYRRGRLPASDCRLMAADLPAASANWSLLDQSGQRWILGRDGLSANDPKRASEASDHVQVYDV